MDIRQKLMNKIGFLQWAKIDPNFVWEYSYYRENLDRVYISPDVRGIHIIWQDEDEISHEIADYPHIDDENFAEWLGNEIGDDRYGEAYTNDWNEILNDYGTYQGLELSKEFLESL